MFDIPYGIKTSLSLKIKRLYNMPDKFFFMRFPHESNIHYLAYTFTIHQLIFRNQEGKKFMCG